MSTRFVVPPAWPTPPAGWVPPEGWQAPEEWGPVPEGWRFWQEYGVVPTFAPVQTAPSAPAPLVAAPLAPAPLDTARRDTAPSGAVAPAYPLVPTAVPRHSWWRRLGWLAVLVGGLISYVVVNQTMLDTQNVLFFPTLLLIGSVTVPAGVLLLEYAIGRGLEGRGGLIIGTAVVAGIVGVTLAGAIESSFSGATSQVYVGVAVVEELAKMLVPLAIFIIARRRTAGMGLALGIAAGAGFAVLETMGYAFYALVSRGGGLAAMQETLQLRALLAPASHVAWSGLVGWALWRIGATPAKRFAVTGLAVSLAAAVGLHYLWDVSDELAPHIAIAVVSVVILITLMVLSALRDAARTHTGPVSGPAFPPPVAVSPVSPVAAEVPWVSVPDRRAA